MQPISAPQRTTLPRGLEFQVPQRAPRVTGKMARGEKLHTGNPFYSLMEICKLASIPVLVHFLFIFAQACVPQGYAKTELLDAP